MTSVSLHLLYPLELMKAGLRVGKGMEQAFSNVQLKRVHKLWVIDKQQLACQVRDDKAGLVGSIECPWLPSKAQRGSHCIG